MWLFNVGFSDHYMWINFKRYWNQYDSTTTFSNGHCSFIQSARPCHKCPVLIVTCWVEFSGARAGWCVSSTYGRMTHIQGLAPIRGRLVFHNSIRECSVFPSPLTPSHSSSWEHWSLRTTQQWLKKQTEISEHTWCSSPAAVSKAARYVICNRLHRLGHIMVHVQSMLHQIRAPPFFTAILPNSWPNQRIGVRLTPVHERGNAIFLLLQTSHPASKQPDIAGWDNCNVSVTMTAGLEIYFLVIYISYWGMGHVHTTYMAWASLSMWHVFKTSRALTHRTKSSNSTMWICCLNWRSKRVWATSANLNPGISLTGIKIVAPSICWIHTRLANSLTRGYREWCIPGLLRQLKS